MIRIQEQPFDIGDELKSLRGGNHAIGGTVVFAGSVRDLSDGQSVSAMTLEHYPGMTEKALEEIEQEAMRRWPLEASLIIHRVGRMEPGEDIVLVITASPHREAAFEACHFLIDWLKTRAPFWKLEENAQGSAWVEAKASDDEAASRWAR
ncbi:molybdenum cofactor biosynthesis protein MoaE [Aestuariivirga sp.]|uniref:molybdenum cofactor biosynthesis protein MoaE n=1 Tax=Aestuariivirga sp. TaxID=2650926 RepID=UPI0039E60ABF